VQTDPTARTYDEGSGSAADGIALMNRALASRDPLELAIAGFLAGYKGNTFRSYKNDLQTFIQWCAQHDLAPLDAKRPHIELYIRWCEQRGWAESTVRRKYIVCKLFYAAAVEDDYIVKNPVAAVRPPKIHEESQRRTFLTPLEFAAFLQAARELGVMEHALAALLGLSGLRVAEACSLNIESLGDEGGYDSLRFIGKGGKPADIPLPIPVMRAVRAAIGDRTSGPLLLSKAGSRMDPRCANRTVVRIAKHAKVNTDISPHSLRRTFCTSGLVSGVPMRDMQIAMRHADPRTTGKYDMAKNNKDRHASHRVASFLAGMTG
jgi:integrase/recombinase XerD